MNPAIYIRKNILNLTQEKLSEHLDVTQPTIHRWEESGVIPAKHQRQIREFASEKGIYWNDSWFFSIPDERDSIDFGKKEEVKFKIKEEWLEKARTLSKALPYMKSFANKTFVIKFGGHAMHSTEAANAFARDIVLIKQVGINPIVVHGGGPQIDMMLKKLKIKSSFVDGMRVTTPESIKTIEMVLSGSINKEIVSKICSAGGNAIGVSGKDGNLIVAKKLRVGNGDKKKGKKIQDLGLVGEPIGVNHKILKDLENSGIIPVVAPIGSSLEGSTYNINADHAAGALSESLRASRLLLLTDTVGVQSRKGKLLSNLDITQSQKMIKDGVILGGMIPKVQTCIKAIQNGVEAAVILDGRVPHALLLEIFTDRGFGTMISNKLKKG